MLNTNKKILLLTLVHPDFLPPVYAAAQTLRDLSYDIHILTFDSYVNSHLDIGNNIVIESVGKHHDIGIAQRLRLRKKFVSRATQLANDAPLAIISFCPFSLLTGISIKKNISLIYIALEVADFIPKVFFRSPLSHLNNLRAIKNLHKAGIVATPSIQRSAWLAGRSRINFMPYTILNTAYSNTQKNESDLDIFKKLIPDSLINKTLILYTGSINDHLCIKELVTAFNRLNDPNCALIITGMKDTLYCNEVTELATKGIHKENIVLFPQVPRKDMLALQTHANIGVCLAKEYDDNVESKMMAPNKVGEYLAKGLYLLGVKNEYMRPFEMKGIASLASSIDVNDIEAALKLAINAVADEKYKANISTFVEDYFCMQQQLKPVINYLADIKNRSN